MALPPRERGPQKIEPFFQGIPCCRDGSCHSHRVYSHLRAAVNPTWVDGEEPALGIPADGAPHLPGAGGGCYPAPPAMPVRPPMPFHQGFH